MGITYLLVEHVHTLPFFSFMHLNFQFCPVFVAEESVSSFIHIWYSTPNILSFKKVSVVEQAYFLLT